MKPEDSMTLALAERNQQIALPTPAQMMLQMVQSGVTTENVAAFRDLAELQWKFEQRDSERQFAEAFNKLQAELPPVEATRTVPNRDGTPRYAYAPYEEIMEQVKPMLNKHGFTVSFSQRFGEGRLIAICTLQHIGGHKRENEFAVRIGAGPPSASECQADGAAATYAKRFAICNALNIVIEVDSDARAEGGTITREQAEELRRRVRATGSDEKAFLKFAGADSYEDIREAKYAILDSSLRRKEKTS